MDMDKGSDICPWNLELFFLGHSFLEQGNDVNLFFSP